MEKTWPIVKEQDHGFREKTKRENIKKNNIYGVEIEEVAFGLSTTNMLIHGDMGTGIPISNWDPSLIKKTSSSKPILISSP